MAFDSTGNVYVADYSNHRIQVFTAEGEYLRQFGWKIDGYEGPEIKFPTGICIDRGGVVYVTEEVNHLVSLFKCDGTHMKSFGSYGSKLGNFKGPHGIAHENIYVADSHNNCI